MLKEHLTPPVDARTEATADIRQRTLSYLGDSGVVSLVELSDHVARSGDDSPERLAVLMHHVHLPKLDHAGYVCYDPSDHTATLVESKRQRDPRSEPVC